MTLPLIPHPLFTVYEDDIERCRKDGLTITETVAWIEADIDSSAMQGAWDGISREQWRQKAYLQIKSQIMQKHRPPT